MPATFSVTDLYGLTEPSGGHVQEVSKEEKVEIKTVRSAAGVTVKALPTKMITSNISMKFKGGLALTGVTAGAISAGSVQMIEINLTETNNDFCEGDITAVAYSNVGD